MDLRVQTAGPWSWPRTAAFAAAMSAGSFIGARISEHSFWRALTVFILWSAVVLVIFGILDRRRPSG